MKFTIVVELDSPYYLGQGPKKSATFEADSWVAAFRSLPERLERMGLTGELFRSLQLVDEERR